MTRVHQFIAATLFAVMGLPAMADSLSLATDLQQDGVLSKRNGTPIMVFYTSDTCPYCEEVRDLYLEPMVSSGQYKNRLLIRMVDVSGGKSLRDFHGKRTNHEDFANEQGTSLTPVLKFYDDQGNELVPELLGYSSPDFYLAYLEGAIETSIKKLRPNTKTARADPGSFILNK